MVPASVMVWRGLINSTVFTQTLLTFDSVTGVFFFGLLLDGSFGPMVALLVIAPKGGESSAMEEWNYGIPPDRVTLSCDQVY